MPTEIHIVSLREREKEEKRRPGCRTPKGTASEGRPYSRGGTFLIQGIQDFALRNLRSKLRHYNGTKTRVWLQQEASA